MLNIISVIFLLCFVLYYLIVKEICISIGAVWYYFVIPIVLTYLIGRIITFEKEKWMHYSWKSFWSNFVVMSFVLSLYIGGIGYFIFDTMNYLIPTDNKSYKVHATIEAIHLNKKKQPSLNFKLDDINNEYSKKINHMDFSKSVNDVDIEKYNVGDKYIIFFKNGFWGFPIYEGMEKVE